MAGVGLNQNRESLLKAYKEVSDPNGSTDWALFGYEGKTNVLKVQGTGDGGIEELVDELSSGRIQYAYLKMSDPNTGLAKFVLVNWQGEGVPEMRKGSCASHFRDVSNFFKGAHITIHARSEDDLDEDVVKGKVAKASGANYSIHKEKAQVIPEAGPVGSVYKKTVPNIRSDARDKFWEEQQKLEQQRQENEAQRRTEEQKKLEDERKRREEDETKLREEKEQERLKKIREIKAAERQANTVNKDEQKQKWEDMQREALKDDEERKKRSEQMRKERAAEARALVSKRDNNPRSVFDDKPRSMFDDDSPTSPKSPTSPTSPGIRPPLRKLQHSFLKGESEETEPGSRKQPIQLPTAEPEFDRPSLAKAPASPPVTQPVRQPEPEPEPEPEEDEPPAEPAPVPPKQPAPVPTSPVSPAAPISQGTTEIPKTRNLLAEGLPKRQTSDDEDDEDQDWDDDAAAHQPQAIVATPAAEPVTEENYYEEPPAESPVADQREKSPFQDEGTIFLNKGQCARALYDYQAEDDTEITFDPDDFITNIEQIDEGWWTGTAPDGHHGMFPANYVELI